MPAIDSAMKALGKNYSGTNYEGACTDSCARRTIRSSRQHSATRPASRGARRQPRATKEVGPRPSRFSSACWKDRSKRPLANTAPRKAPQETPTACSRGHDHLHGVPPRGGATNDDGIIAATGVPSGGCRRKPAAAEAATRELDQQRRAPRAAMNRRGAARRVVARRSFSGR